MEYIDILEKRKSIDLNCDLMMIHHYWTHYPHFGLQTCERRIGERVPIHHSLHLDISAISHHHQGKYQDRPDPTMRDAECNVESHRLVYELLCRVVPELQLVIQD